MKKNFKRWLAFLLAVVVIATTCIHSSDAFLWADEEDAPVTEPEETMQTLTVDSSDDAGSGGDESGDEQYSGDEESSEESDGEDSWEEEGSEDDAESDGSEDGGEDYGDGEDGSEGDAADSAEGSDGENADVADDGSGSGSAGEDVGGENTENSEDTDASEEEEGFDYVICFYFDGTEDESTRISGTDGKPGESILGLVEIAHKKEHDGKNYVLDRIENKDGVITEDAGSNVVSVYYVAATSDDKTLVQGSEDKKEKDEQTEDKTDVLSEKKLSTSAGASKVTVSGRFPEGASVNVSSAGGISSVARSAIEKAIEGDNRKLGSLKGYDITITDADNEKVTLSGKVRVTIEGTGIEDDYAYVYYVDGDAVQNMSAEKSGDMVSFETDHFSEYWVAGANEIEKDDEPTTLEDDILVEEEGSVITGCAVSAERINIKVGETTQAYWYTTPENIENSEGVTWTSLKPEVATVDADGVITGVGAGTVNIVGTSNDDPAFSAHIAITVREVGVGNVRITSKINEYYEAGAEIQLACDVKDEDDKATDKYPITWSSSDDAVATVDGDGNVTALRQGKTKIRAQVLDVYDEVEIQVYDETPKMLDIQVWVTNQRRGTVSINVPSDGTPVSLQDVIPSICNLDGKDYSFTGKVSYVPSDDKFGWDAVQSMDNVNEIRYFENKFEYRIDGESNWQTGKLICAFYSNLREIDDETGIRVNVGDWPYDDKQTSKIVNIEIYDENNSMIHSDVMYYDDGSNYTLGHITFGCNTAVYKVEKAIVSKWEESKEGNGEWKTIKTYNEDALNGSFTGISVDFTQPRIREEFTVAAYIVPKEFTVTYDTNGGEGEAPTQEPKTAVGNEANDDNSFEIASGKGLRKPGYTFAGWAYGGKTYYEGDEFKMPAQNVTFEAVWRPVRQIIRYRSESPIKGSVSQTEELFDADEESDIQGSTAVPSDGYRFVGWKDENGSFVGDEEHYTPGPNASGIYESHIYIAYFEEDEYEVAVSVTNGTIGDVTGGEQKGEGIYKVSAGSTFTVNYAPFGGYELSEIKVDDEAVSIENFADGYSIPAIDANHTIDVVYVRDADSIDVNGDTYEYDTAPHKVTWTGVNPEETIEFSNNEVSGWKSDENFEWPVNAGTHKIYVRVSNAEGKQVALKSGEIIIKKRPVTITVPDAVKEFGGDKFNEFDPAKIAIMGTATEEQIKELNAELKDINLTVIRSADDTNAPYDEAHQGVLRLASGDTAETLNSEFGNFEFTIKNGDLTITRSKKILKVSIENKNVPYSKTPYSLESPVVTLGDSALTQEQLSELEYVYTITSNGTSEVSSDNPERTDAGSYTISVVAKLEGYLDASASATLTINKKTVTITAPDAEAVLIGSGTETRLEDLQFVNDDIKIYELCDGDELFVSGATKYEVKLAEGVYNKVQSIPEVVGIGNYTEADVNPNYSITKVTKGTLNIKGTVTYDKNGEDVIGELPKGGTYSNGDTITVEDSWGRLTKPKAVFLGWSRTPTSLVTLMEEETAAGIIEGNIKMGEANITLFAVWAKDTDEDGKPDYRQFQLKYNMNDGSDKEETDSGYYNANETVTLKTYDEGNEPKQENAVFLGWSKEQHKAFTSQPEESVFITDVTFVDSDITVYAVWAEDTKGPNGEADGTPDYLQYSVKFVDKRFGNKDVDSADKGYKYSVNDTVVISKILGAQNSFAVPTEYLFSPDTEKSQVAEFDSWKNGTEQPYASDASFELTVADNVELTAQWKVLKIDKVIDANNEAAKDEYLAGDTAPFLITVENLGDVDLSSIVVEDILEGAKLEGKVNTPYNIGSLPVGEDVKLQAAYEVQNSDFNGSGLKNTATAAIGENFKVYASEQAILSDAENQLTVEKTINNSGSYTGEDGKKYFTVGDTIEFEIKVTNSGARKIEEIEIEDSFTDITLEETGFAASLKNFFENVKEFITGVKNEDGSELEPFDLNPGKTKKFKVEYKIQEKDLDKKGFRNVVKATGKVVVGDSETPVEGYGKSNEIPFDTMRPAYNLTKSVLEPADGALEDGKYKAGSVVTYQIKVENTGNTTIRDDMVIKDQMTARSKDKDGNFTVNAVLEGQISIPTLELQGGRTPESDVEVYWNNDKDAITVTEIPGGSTAIITYTYTVDEKDAGKQITNIAILGDKEAAPESPIEVVNKELTVEKRAAAPKEGDKYKLGETINYTVTVKNTGNVILSDIKVQDILEGGSSQVIPAEGQSEVIESLAVGESKDFSYTYTVIEDDLENKLENKAVAYVDSKEFSSNLVQSEVEDKIETASLEKNITNLSEATGDNGRFKAGDTIRYEIKVENTGTRTLNNVVVTDTMTGMSGEISNVSGVKSYSQNGNEIKFEIEKIPSRGIDKDDNYTGHIATITYDYVVDAKDAGTEISNTAVISSYLDEKNGISDTETVTIEKKSLDITKEIVAVRPGGEAGYEPADSSRSFDTGDTVRFAVKVKNDGNADLTNVTVTDTMSGENSPVADFVPGESDIDSQTIASLKAGEEVTLTYDYTVRPEDISSDIVLTNTAKATSGDVVSREAKVDVQRAGKASGYTVEKKIEPENPDRMYHVGETIPYSIEVLNTGNITYPAGEVVVADVLTGDGEEIAVDADSINVTSGNATWNNGQFVLNVPLGWRERVRIDYTYKVAPADEGKELINTAYGSEMKQKDSTVPVTIEKKKLSVTKEVTSTPSNGEAYAVDEYISFKVTLKNDGNVPLEDILVTDHLWGSAGESVELPLLSDEGQNPFTDVISLGVNETKIYEYTYQVKESDAGTRIWNEIDASIEEGNSEHVKTPPVKIEDPDPKVSLTKSVLTPPDGEDGKYKTETKVTYEIRVKNTGNTTLNNVTVKDTMAGAAGRVAGTSVTGARMTSSFNGGKWEYTFEINGEIARGEEKVITYDYVIQKEDAGKKIGNTVAVDGDDITTDLDSDDSEEIVVENRKLTVTKTIREPERVYKLGEEILFDVKVDNEGDVILYGIDLVDEMLGGAAGEAELVSGNASDIVLNPGVAVDLVYKYVVQPGDIANNALKNKLTATAEDNTKGEDETDYIKIEGQNPAFSIQKSVISTGSGENGKYAIGDTIDYEITITNDGNVALPSMTVADRMENASGAIIADSVKAVIDSGEGGETPVAVTWNKAAGKFELGASIPIGGKAVITYGYEVVEADAGKTIVNVAGKPTDPGSKETQTEIEDRRIIIDKLVTSTPANPARGYVAGERITFDVRVANPGNVSLSGISIADEMQNAFGAAILVDGNGNALNDNSDKNISLEAGENLVLHYSYEVTRDDIVAGGKEIANKATAEPESGELRGTTEDTSRPVQVDRLHTLTVYYQYADGSTAVETLVQEFAYGDSFAFTIPAITGYTSTLEGNPVQQAVMFDSTLFNDEDPVFTIIYSAIPVTEPGTEPETEPTATPVPGGGEPEPEPDTPVPPVPPVPPVDDVPVPEAVIVPVAPAAVAAAPGILGGGAGLVAIGDEPVPLDGVITQDDDGNVVIVPVDEVEIPLADRELDDHKCCILSFLLMLATLIIYSWFTHSMKKRQKKLAELKDQLAEETLKRQLGITDNENSAR